MSADAMTTERIEIDLAAPPARVYEAIATADGVRSWWVDGDIAERVGTTIRLGLTPIDRGRGTHLSFVHEGLAGLGCEEMCTKGWDHYIRTSLRGLVESGEGEPGPGRGSS